jgi:hypothetical protein
MIKSTQKHCITRICVNSELLQLDINFADGWQTSDRLGDFLASLAPLYPLLDKVIFKQAIINEGGK